MLRFLGEYASLDTSQRRKVNRMKWNDIPFDVNATPAEKALEFDLQIEENERGAEVSQAKRDAAITAGKTVKGQS